MTQHPRPATQGKDVVVFWILRPTRCSECGDDLDRGRFLRLEKDQPLCLSCADLDHLVYLPSGNAALTRRARKRSTLSTVVVRFSRTRKRYERQGLLVEEAALAQAEQECLADAEIRTRNRERARARAPELDAQYVAAFAERIGDLYPGSSASDRTAIAEHACRRSSGRIGRTASAKVLEAGAIDLAVRAHVRHRETAYDELLMTGWDREDARAKVADTVALVLERWRTPSDRGAETSGS